MSQFNSDFDNPEAPLGLMHLSGVQRILDESLETFPP